MKKMTRQTAEVAATHQTEGLSPSKFRVWIVIVGGIILLCAMILSYSHTVELFLYAGYFWILAHIGTVMIELTFFLGTSVIILSRAFGMRAGWQARATFFFGLLLVLWSNVSSGILLLDKQWTGVVLGVAVVTCLFLMEATVSRALFMFRADVLDAAPTVSVTREAVQESRKFSSSSSISRADVSSTEFQNAQPEWNPESSSEKAGPSRNNISSIESSSAQPVQSDASGSSFTGQGSESSAESQIGSSDVDSRMSNDSNSSSVQNSDRKLRSSSSSSLSNVQKSSDALTSSVQSDQSSSRNKSSIQTTSPVQKSSIEKSSDLSSEKTGASSVQDSSEESRSTVLEAGKSTVKKSSEKDFSLSNSRKTGGRKLEVLKGGAKLSDRDEEIMEVALEIIQREGKCGRPRLKKETGCNEGQAKRVLNAIREEKKAKLG